MRKVQLILFGVALVALIAGCSSGGGDEAAQTTTTEDAAKETSAEMASAAIAALANPVAAEDPVCNMKLTDAYVSVELEGKTYGFCSAKCAESFEAEPAKYLAAADSHEGHNH